MARRFLIAAAVMALGAVFVAPAAHAEFGIEKWSAIHLHRKRQHPGGETAAGAAAREPVGGIPPALDASQCSPTTPEKWFNQAAGHPNFAYHRLHVQPAIGRRLQTVPDGFVKDIVVDTPEGLSVNPEAAAAVHGQTALDPEMSSRRSGRGQLLHGRGRGAALCGPPVAGTCTNIRAAIPVYNLVPFDGVPSMVGFLGTRETDRSSSARSTRWTSTSPSRSAISSRLLEGGSPVIGSRLVFNGKAGNGTYLTMPSNCAGRPDDESLRRFPRRTAENSTKKRIRPPSAQKAARKCRSTRRSTSPRRAARSTRRWRRPSTSGSRSTPTSRSPTRI